ncbi:hypothetical protein Maes01_02778 [Microbulbifer aestuariivivens]|uniref:Uncharacterized protein n=1 Tax=Microbulbifer aestuariivivens TaxID=1908308 RepID=A0ABP9WUA5_9GAMM
MANHQRKNAVSNAAVGADFEELVHTLLSDDISSLTRPFWLPIGHLHQKQHKFDLGCKDKKIIVECKSHTWTESGNIPSAKLTTWDQAMLYFYLAPRSFRKVFTVRRDLNPRTGESLAEYYVRTHFHVIPDEVEFWEVDENLGQMNQVNFDATSHISGLPEVAPA